MLAALALWALCCTWTRANPAGATGSPIGGVQRAQGGDAGLSTAPEKLRKLQQTKREFEIRRIVNGADAPEGRFPYVCSLRAIGSNSHICGGTLVAPEWVLTAAHCFDKGMSRNPVVYVGAYGINDASFAEVIRATEVMIHEQWDNKVENGFDIALVHLSRPARRKKPVQMAQSGTVLGDSQFLVAAGWGRIGTRGPLPSVLQFADQVMHVSRENCRGTWPSLRSDMICSFSRIQGTCSGDSGGPLVLGHAKGGSIKDGDPELDLLVGIVSFGPRVCAPIRPDVSTSVGSFREWIDATMGDSSPTSVPSPAPARPPPVRSPPVRPPPVRSPPVPVPARVRPPSSRTGRASCKVFLGIDFYANATINNGALDVTASEAECCALCGRTPGCNVWTRITKDITYNKEGECWMREVVPAMSKRPFRNSGFKPGRDEATQSPAKATAKDRSSTEAPGGASCKMFLGIDFNSESTINNGALDVTASEAECCALCNRTPACKVWTRITKDITYNKEGECWMREVVPAMSKRPFRNSGFKSG